MQVNNNSSVNFNGYKNLITSNAKVSKNEGFNFLSMQLNNVGKNDLDIWKNFQQKLFGIKNPSDVLTVELFQGFGERTLHLGDKNIDPNFYSEKTEKESTLMQTYTWLADLTKRIMNENNPIKDRDVFSVMQKTIANILPLMGGNIGVTSNFVFSSQNPANKPQETALDINKNIDKIMQDYLL